jgi:membrane-associated phospholipid phosphatase
MYPILPIVILIVLFLILWALFYFIFAGVAVNLRKAERHLSDKILRSKLKVWATTKYPGLSKLRQYVPTLIVLFIGIIMTLIVGDLFLDLAKSFQLSDSPVYTADHAINSWFQTERHLGLTEFFSILTSIAGPIGMGALIIIVAFLLIIRKHTASAVFIVSTSIGGFLLNAGLKMFFTRARPDAATAIAVADWYSFPSGHAMASFIVLGALAYLVLRLQLGWMLKSFLLAFITILILLVGMSRLYLGVHWTSDIFAGWSAGTLWLVWSIASYETLISVRTIRRKKKTRPHNSHNKNP